MMKTRVHILLLPAAFALLIGVNAILSGCMGTYQTTLREYAKPEHERLAIRLEEVSQQQQKSRKEIGRVMQFAFRYGQDDGTMLTMSKAGLQIKFDRAELHVWNTRRRLLAVQDSAERYFGNEHDPNAIDAGYVTYMRERHDHGLAAALERLMVTQDVIEGMLALLHESTPIHASEAAGSKEYLTLETLRERYKLMTQKTIDTQLETGRFAASLRSAESVRIASGMPR